LAAAGYSPADELQLTPTNVALPKRIRNRQSLKVISDPRFIDSAIFMWLFTTQPFRAVGIGLDCELVKTDWSRVPEEVASHDFAVGFYNRITQDEKPLARVRHWADLARYQGYSLLARRQDCRHDLSLKQGMKYLEKLTTQKKPVIVCMGADTLWQLQDIVPSLKPHLFTVNTYANVDFALREFLAGVGDLFIGGIPQLFVAKEHGCVEILGSKSHPLFFAFNSLICPENMVREERALLFSTVSLWYGVVERLKADSAFVDRTALAVIRMLKDLGVEGHNHREEFFQRLFHPKQGAQVYEVFADHPTALLDDIVDSIQLARKLLGKKATDAVLTLHGKRIKQSESSQGVGA
jgi:hypothetical protein